jgi:hypothetical protein
MVISPHNYLINSPTKRVSQAVKISYDLDSNTNQQTTKVSYGKADRHGCTYDLDSQMDLASYMSWNVTNIY